MIAIIPESSWSTDTGCYKDGYDASASTLNVTQSVAVPSNCQPDIEDLLLIHYRHYLNLFQGFQCDIYRSVDINYGG